MAMTGKGLIKLLEELGELSQIAAKKLAYFDTDLHPDSEQPMSERLEDEMADVAAATAFVASQLKLDTARIDARSKEKLAKYVQWNLES